LLKGVKLLKRRGFSENAVQKRTADAV